MHPCPTSITIPTRNAGRIDSRRRTLILGAGAAIATLPVARAVRAQAGAKIRIAYWPALAELPFYVAIEKGFFKEAGIDVQPMRLESAAQVIQAMRSGQAEGSANGASTFDLAIGEMKAPGAFKIIAVNASNTQFVFDEFLVAKNSTLESLRELQGKNVGAWPDRQNIALARAVLEKNGVTNATVTALPISKHVSAVETAQVDAVYTLEPAGTLGRLKGTTRVLEPGVVAKYVLGDAKALWLNGAAALSAEFMKGHPAEAKKYLAAYRHAVEFVRKEPAEARRYLKKYTTLDERVAGEAPLQAFAMYDELKANDVAMLQKYYDFLVDGKILDRRVSAAPMIYKA